MIKRMPFPVLRRVTKITFVPESSFMIVIFFVTAIANGWGILKERSLVAFPASDRFMFSCEGEVCLLMVEFLNVFPVCLGMTLFAGLTQSSFVFVILAVATQTLAGDLPSFLGMTLNASHCKVFPHEWILCGRMIKANFFPVL
jgi:hypothetical protein